MVFVAIVAPLCAIPQQVVGSDSALFVSRVGSDTVIVEGMRRRDRTIDGVIVVRVPSTKVTHYRAELDASGHVRRFVSWPARDVAVDSGTNGAPAISIDFHGDSATGYAIAGNGERRNLIAGDTRGAAPLLHYFYGYPYAMVELGFRLAAAQPPESAAVRWYSPGGKTFVLALSRLGDGRLAVPYMLASSVPMVRDARLYARLGVAGLELFDATETTFKVLVSRAPWQDPLDLARRFAAVDGAGRAVGVLSPRVSRRADVGDLSVELSYSSPRARGRRVFFDVVPAGKVWRAGADAATHIKLSRNVLVQDKPVPAGVYTLWVIPGLTVDTLIVNGQTQQWGTSYDAGRDVLRVPLRREILAAAVESLLIEVSSAGELSISWGDRRLSAQLKGVF